MTVVSFPDQYMKDKRVILNTCRCYNWL